MHIIFVCTGNICRSPMAEGLLKAHAASCGTGEVHVSSMGTHALDGHLAAVETIGVCRRHGIDVTAHRARSLVLEELRSADHVFTMDLPQKEYVMDMCPGLGDRVALAGSWPQPDSITDCVPDPIGRSRAVYGRVFLILKGHVDRIAGVLGR
jgi:protein-tyrosine-phosphatase